MDDGKTGIMMRWKVVKNDDADDGLKDMLHGTKVLMELLRTWFHTH